MTSGLILAAKKRREREVIIFLVLPWSRILEVIQILAIVVQLLVQVLG
jgi:hypothetical protein